MPTYVVGPKELGASLEKWNNEMFESLVGDIRKTVKVNAPRIAQQLIDGESPPPVDRGTYRRSFSCDDIPGGVVFYNFAPHAAIIEEGRRPGAKMPPLQMIFDWVKRKRIGAKVHGPVQEFVGPQQKGRRMSGRKAAVMNAQRWAALQIARKIAARGLPAHKIVSRTHEKLMPLVETAIAKRLGTGPDAHA